VLKLYLRGASTAGNAAPRPDCGGGGGDGDARVRRDRRGGGCAADAVGVGFCELRVDRRWWRDAGGGRGALLLLSCPVGLRRSPLCLCGWVIYLLPLAFTAPQHLFEAV
jgi:hypothetical protein